jgi:hypothetical protein
MSKQLRVMLPYLVLTLSFLLLSSAIALVGDVPTLRGIPRPPFMNQTKGTNQGNNGDGPLGWDIGNELDPEKIVEMDASCGIDLPLFNITGITGTPYIRVKTGEIYNGKWYTTDTNKAQYNNEVLPVKYSGDPKTIFIDPIAPITNYLPVAAEPIQIQTGQELVYYPDSLLFQATTPIDKEYRLSYNIKTPDIEVLEDSYLKYNIKYLQVPYEIQTQLVNMTKEITLSIDSDYHKIKAIETYLKNNYAYNLNYTTSPVDVDPTLWFLFENKEGVCIHYNSALVLMARSIGLPMRLVTGFKVNPNRHLQTVGPEQAHAWAEAYFRDVGWTRFDATGSLQEPSRIDNLGSIQTNTTITQQDTSCYKENTFTVQGKVTDSYGSPVDGLNVLVYIKEDKDLDGALSGKTLSRDGYFTAECSIPQNLPPGAYNVEAVTLGNHVYNWSSSDPPINILARSYIDYNTTSKVIAHRPAIIQGRLLETNTDAPIKTNFMNIIIEYNNSDQQLIRLRPNSINIIVGGYHLLTTSNEGAFSFDNSFPPGSHKVVMEYSGSLFINGTRSSYNLTAIPLEISPTPMNALARGERAEFTGKVHAEELIPEPGEEVVEIYLDDQYVGAASVNEEGWFTQTYVIPEGEDLRDAQIHYLLENSQVYANQSTIIGLKPRINYQIREKGTWENPVQIEAVLLNDRGTQMINKELVLNSGNQTTQTLYTDVNGRAIFTVNLDSRPTDNTYRFTITHPGSEYIIPTTITGSIQLNPVINYIAILSWLAGISTISGGIYYGYKKVKRIIPDEKTSTQTEKQITEAKNTVDKTGLYIIKAEKAKIDINLLDIPPAPPLVWGTNQPLTIETSLKTTYDKDNKDISVTGITKNTALKLDKNGETTHQFSIPEKGLHKITFTYNDKEHGIYAETLLVLKIVDYREEIIRQFNQDFKTQLEISKELNYTATARELLQAHTELEPQIVEAIEQIVYCFEEATYSHHPITETDYRRYMKNRNDLEVYSSE